MLHFFLVVVSLTDPSRSQEEDLDSRVESQGGEEGSTPGHPFSWLAESSLLCDVPPSEDVETSEETKISQEVDSSCTEDGSVQDHRLVRCIRARSV